MGKNGPGNDIDRESEGGDEDFSKGSCGVGGGADDVAPVGDENSDGGFCDVGGGAGEGEESEEDGEDFENPSGTDVSGDLNGEVRKMNFDSPLDNECFFR